MVGIHDCRLGCAFRRFTHLQVGIRAVAAFHWVRRKKYGALYFGCWRSHELGCNFCFQGRKLFFGEAWPWLDFLYFSRFEWTRRANFSVFGYMTSFSGVLRALP